MEVGQVNDHIELMLVMHNDHVNDQQYEFFNGIFAGWWDW